MIVENWAPLLRQWRVRNVLLEALLKTTPRPGTFAAFLERSGRTTRHATFADYFNLSAQAGEHED